MGMTSRANIQGDPRQAERFTRMNCGNITLDTAQDYMLVYQPGAKQMTVQGSNLENKTQLFPPTARPDSRACTTRGELRFVFEVI